MNDNAARRRRRKKKKKEGVKVDQEAVDLEGGNISGVARESQHELVDNGVVTGEKDRLSRVT